MSILLKKLILSFLSFLILFFSIAPNFAIAKAQTSTWYNTDFRSWYKKVYDENTSPGSEIFGERYTAAQVQWVIYGLFSYILNAGLGNTPEGQAVVSCSLGQNVDINACVGPIESLLQASVGNTTLIAEEKQPSLLSLVFADRPLSGISYVRDGLQNFSLVPVAKAQNPGFGFDALAPVQSMWKGVRDIAFGLFVLAAIVLSFMIMFRVKISPQVVISVQSAIPKLIIALVLVTFSYAIAGFVIDLMYVVLGLISLMGPSLSSINIPSWAVFKFLTGLSILISLGFYIFASVFTFIVLMAISLGAIGGLVTTVVAILMLVVLLVLIIVYFIMSIKILWALLKAFAMFLLNVIFGPLQIIAGVIIPNFGFGAWLKSMAANLSVFIVTGTLMLFSYVFLINAIGLGLKDLRGDNFIQLILNAIFGVGATTLVSNVFTRNWPPLLGTVGDSSIGVAFIFLGVSFVLFTLIPKSTEIVQGLITGKPFAYGTAVGEAFGPIPFTSLGRAGLSAYVGRKEEIRRDTADSDRPYLPSKSTQVLRTLGIIKT